MSRHSSLFMQELESSSSDDDHQFFIDVKQIILGQVTAPKHGGSISGHKVVRRKREAGHWRLYEDYFLDDATYGPKFFRWSFVFF